MPFFSVIIPLYNKEPFIADTLNSVLSQTFPDFEIIIVNDGSTDAGEEKVLQFKDPRIRYYIRENKGVAAARNLGITLANAPYIAFLDSDDLWYPDFLQTIHRNIGRFPEQKVFSAAIEIETAKNIIPAQYSIKKTGYVEVVISIPKLNMRKTRICGFASGSIFRWFSIGKSSQNMSMTTKASRAASTIFLRKAVSENMPSSKRKIRR